MIYSCSGAYIIWRIQQRSATATPVSGGWDGVASYSISATLPFSKNWHRYVGKCRGIYQMNPERLDGLALGRLSRSIRNSETIMALEGS
jgi:hypothetical protein